MIVFKSAEKIGFFGVVLTARIIFINNELLTSTLNSKPKIYMAYKEK